MTAKSTILKAMVPLAVAGMLLVGCSGGSTPAPTETSTAQPPSEPTGTLRINWGNAPTSWAPGARTEFGLMAVPYETLVLLSEDYEILPNLATDWEQGAKDLTLTLRDDVTFHDGTPFNAEAVKANIEYVRDNPGAYSGPLQAVASVDIVDEFTAKINFKFPAPSFLTMLTRNNVLIASPAALADGSIVNAPVGTGPWKYDTANSVDGTKYAFTLNEDYWGDMVYFENVEVYSIADDTSAVGALVNGEIDVTDVEDEQVARVESTANLSSYNYPSLRNNVVFFDRAPGGVFGDVEVRQAVCSALDVEALIEYGQNIYDAPQQHFLEGEPGYNPEIIGYPTDLEAGQELLGSNTVAAAFPSAPFLKSQLEVYADQMSQLEGVDITVQELAIPDFQSTWNSGQYALGVGSNNEITPYDWYASWFAAGARQNPSGYESPELKAAADAAIAAGSSDEADALWAEVMKVIIDDEALACGFSVPGQVIGYDNETVAGIEQDVHFPYIVNMINYRTAFPVVAAE
ncbi:ABC transporter substrate-binding protein [Microbacterium sediminicola]|uniref:ABC transporter substrate-binding protein n=1 Tax=Microbacterium sediminicola TaxID=415210 RepID=A0ABN2IGN7_9MICO